MPRTATAFEKKYTEEPNTGCFLWTHSYNSDGYGSVRYNGKTMGAHRASYLHYIGPIPKGLCVCHKCDNPSCVNPEHLFLGTHKENVLDCKSKGRLNRTGAKGEKQHKAKLTEDLVRWIRTRPMPYRKMASLLGMSNSVILDVLVFRSWKHVTT